MVLLRRTGSDNVRFCLGDDCIVCSLLLCMIVGSDLHDLIVCWIQRCLYVFMTNGIIKGKNNVNRYTRQMR
jgi:hypothetical protein